MNKKGFSRLLLLVFAVVLTALSASSCKLTDDDKLYGLDVVMSSKNVDMTLYDFSQSYYNGQYYQYLLYGFIDPEQYCDMIIDDLSSFMCMLNAAYDSGLELTEEELQEIHSNIDTQYEQLLESYKADVAEGTENVREEEEKLLAAELKKEGMDITSFLELAIKNLCMYKIANTYYENLNNSVEVENDEVLGFVEEQIEQLRGSTVSEFVSMISDYNAGSGAYPAYVPDDCFSVNHIYLAFTTASADDGSIQYDPESRSEDEAKLEALFPETAGFDEFMELETEYGEDPGMDQDTYRDSGYVVHGSLDKEYFAGFVYASMNLYLGEWTPQDPDYELPTLAYFDLEDGTRIVKVKTESGVHYIIINKEYSKGEVPYEIGDAKWESWKSSVLNTKLDKLYDELNEKWQNDYPIEIDREKINKYFGSSET